MAPVAVATDSTHYLPKALADERGVHQVSLYVGWAGAPVRELEMDGFDGFYERLRTDPELPSTSQPSIGDFLAVWEPLLEQGFDVVSVHLAGGISGTVGAARQAHALLDERGLGGRVEVIDGETGCGGEGLLVLAAAAAAAAGGDKDAVIERVREARGSLRIWFALDTLEYLRRGGRIGKAQAWLGGRCGSSRSFRSSSKSCPSNACGPPPAHSSEWFAMPRSCRRRAPTVGSSSTSRRPSRQRG